MQSTFARNLFGRAFRKAGLVGVIGLLTPMTLLTGCIDTQVKIRLEADGSGTRSVEMVWQESDLKDVGLGEEDLRVLLDLPSDGGWVMRRERRPVRDGSLEPHVVFQRTVTMISLESWHLEGQDLRVKVDTVHSARMHDEILVEMGRGSGYRTLSYSERLDGHEIRELLNRMTAHFLSEKLTSDQLELDETEKAEIRGLLLGHLSHYDVWALEDEEADGAWDALVQHLGPQLADILRRHERSTQDIEAMHQRLHEVFGDPGVDEWLEDQLPGLSLLALMNLKFEVSMPGIIIESNADRVGEGFAAWESPAWASIRKPLVFRVRSRIVD